MPIRLPQKPKDEDYEDLVSSSLITLGYFIETNLHLSEEGTEILEVDHIATPMEDPLENCLLVEAKSGKSGFKDLFKLYGWMQYLGIKRGCLFRTKESDEQDKKAIAKITSATGIGIVTVDLASSTYNLDFLNTTSKPISQKVAQAMFNAGWFGRIAQRRCQRAFLDFAKSQREVQAVLAASQYQREVEQALLARTPLERVQKLYAAYSRAPNITGDLVTHLSPTNPSGEWDKVRDTSERLALQHTLVMEHRARLGIIKNAMLHSLAEESAQASTHLSEQVDWATLPVLDLPHSFKKGLTALGRHPHRTKIPRLFQVFIEVFGGFYHLSNEDDLLHISDASAIPKKQIVPAMEMFNDFFPTQNGWFIPVKDELCKMKMIPAVFRGTGGFVRKALHSEAKTSTLYPNMHWLVQNWYNALYEVLKPDLTVPDSTK